MSEKVVIGSATLYLSDCIDVMSQYSNHHFELAITDPPYFDGPNKSGYYGAGGVARTKHYDTLSTWSVPDSEYFSALKFVSRHQIIWGANHFANRFDSASPGWIVWDKMNGASSFADAELAYCSMSRAVRVFRYVWNGMHQGQYGGNKRRHEPRIHPTQKPVALYEWILDTYAEAGWSILDTHLGSGSSAIAAINRGYQFVGVELDASMFYAACERIEKHSKQGDLFLEKLPVSVLHEEVE